MLKVFLWRLPQSFEYLIRYFKIQAVHLNYRKDIDGLRALALLCVIYSHAFPEKLSGGFIGVNISLAKAVGYGFREGDWGFYKDNRFVFNILYSSLCSYLKE